jgi:dTDP-3-amino-3,4,6-trideoxy-alpha-D-glucose transaminase
MAVPLFDTKTPLAPLRDALHARAAEVLDGGRYILGPEVAGFERELAERLGAAHLLGVANGTDALVLVLRALGVGPGDDVVVPSFTFYASAEAIALTGANPVFCDIDPVHFCATADTVRAALTANTKVVMVVHLFGNVAPVDEVAALGVPVLEDAAQAHGAALDGRRAGGFGDAAAFSFYPTKNLGALGDGGAVVCRRPEVAEAVRSLRHHGAAADDSNRHLRPGGTARLDNLQAALLALRLEHLDEENERRRRAADRYRELLADLPLALPPPEAPGAVQVHHLFVVETAERDRVAAELRAAGIGVGVHYPTPIHLQPAWRHLGYARGDFPVAERLADTCLSLPCFPGIGEEQQARVAGALRKALRRAPAA